MPVKELMKALRIKLIGYYRYYGITDNSNALYRYGRAVNKLLFKWLNRRSQRKSFEWDKFEKLLAKYPLPPPRIYVNIYERKPC